MQIWILLVLFYGISKGFRDAFKKKALEKSGVFEVLFLYTFLSFILVLPFSHDALSMPKIFHPYIVFKSFIIFVSWILSFKAIKKLPVSLMGLLDTSRVVFAMIIGVIAVGESMTTGRYVGLALVLCGLALLSTGKGSAKENVSAKYVVMSLFACLLNALSGIIDKVYMSPSVALHNTLFGNDVLSSSQLQFWYLFYMTLFYALYLVATRTKIDFRAVYKNYWIPVLAVLFVTADRALFIANGSGDSKVTVMTLLKQSTVIVTIVLGKVMFGEKNIVKRAVCACIIIAGIVASVG